MFWLFCGCKWDRWHKYLQQVEWTSSRGFWMWFLALNSQFIGAGFGCTRSAPSWSLDPRRSHRESSACAPLQQIFGWFFLPRAGLEFGFGFGFSALDSSFVHSLNFGTVEHNDATMDDRSTSRNCVHIHISISMSMSDVGYIEMDFCYFLFFCLLSTAPLFLGLYSVLSLCFSDRFENFEPEAKNAEKRLPDRRRRCQRLGFLCRRRLRRRRRRWRCCWGSQRCSPLSGLRSPFFAPEMLWSTIIVFV